MKNIVIKKGHDIRMSGLPTNNSISDFHSSSVSLLPNQFRGVKPKLMVSEGDKVKVGQALFFDKTKPDVKWPSPANGFVKEIKFGPRRVIEKIEIAIEGKETLKHGTLSKEQIKSSNKDTILGHILNANLFPLIRQRPFNKVADPNCDPRDIFISGYNSAPLAVDIHPILERNKEAFQLGLTALSKLTSGEVFLTLKEAIDFEDVQVQTIAGPHPSGNVGIQIHHIKPLKPNEVIWTMNAQHVITLGRLFESGIYDPKIIVSIGGSGADKPDFAKALMGTKIESFLDNQSSNKPVRIISGDVLTGHTVERHDFIGFYDSSITIIDDKVDRPFLGMLSPGSSKTKYSLTNTFLTLTNTFFNFTTSQNGEKRAMVPINAWEKVLPMDILPNPLYRAILAQDVEEMEQLGIWECDDEDFALCSFACPSKIDVGKVIRDGLDLLEQEG